jgi:hypothetical protein
MGINTLSFTDPQEDGAIPPSYYVTMSLFKTANALFGEKKFMFTDPTS